MTSYAKQPTPRNPHLLALARGKECLLRVPGVCNGDPETTVAAHSNQLIHGKSRGLKASDARSVWACARCHTWLDSSYVASREEKQEAFATGHQRQVIEWRKIAAGPEGRDKASALWALRELGELIL